MNDIIRTKLSVVDKEPPRLLFCPQNIEFRLLPGQKGQVVRWREPQFEDNVGVARIQKTRVRLRNLQKTSDVHSDGVFLILRFFAACLFTF